MKISSLFFASSLLISPLVNLGEIFYQPNQSEMANSQVSSWTQSTYGNVNNIKFTGEFSDYNSGVKKLAVGETININTSVSLSGDQEAIEQAIVAFENVDPNLTINDHDDLKIDGNSGVCSFSVTLNAYSNKPCLFTIKIKDGVEGDSNHLTPYAQTEMILAEENSDSSSTTDTTSTSTTDSSSTTDTTSTSATDSSSTTDTTSTSTTDSSNTTDTTSTNTTDRSNTSSFSSSNKGVSDTNSSVEKGTRLVVNTSHSSDSTNDSFKESEKKLPKTNDASKPLIAWAGVGTIALVLLTFWYRKNKKTDQ